MTQTLLQLEGVSMRYANQEVLHEISFAIQSGEFVSIIGPSGTGKSTLLQLVGGLFRPTEGRVFLNGKDHTGIRGAISYMPQQGALMPWRTVEENAMLPLELLGAPRREAREQILPMLAKAGLSGYEKSLPHVLSGGMQQRLAFLRALISPQPILCLDEPLGSLDALTRQQMQQWLLNLWEADRRSVLFVTHSIEEAVYLSDRILLLSGKPATIQADLKIPFPRPRNKDLLYHTEFVELRHKLYSMLEASMYKEDPLE